MKIINKNPTIYQTTTGRIFKEDEYELAERSEEFDLNQPPLVVLQDKTNGLPSCYIPISDRIRIQFDGFTSDYKLYTEKGVVLL